MLGAPISRKKCAATTAKVAIRLRRGLSPLRHFVSIHDMRPTTGMSQAALIAPCLGMIKPVAPENVQIDDAAYAPGAFETAALYCRSTA
jgi:hypothetical protein